MNFDILFHRNSFWPRLTPILCALCVASFLGLNIGGDHMSDAQSQVFGLFRPDAVWTGRPWALITSTFAHIQFMHVLFNVMCLWALGNIFENEFGSLRFGLFFLASAWVSSSLQLFSLGDMGIGMSGVGYALFGFGWIARRRFPAFAQILTQQNVISFLLWMVGCIVLTAIGALSIANGAHVAGLLFGVAVAGVCFVARKPERAASGVGALALVALSLLTLVWCPQSSAWTGLQASRAHAKGDTRTALYWYERIVARDADSGWALHNMAMIYAQKNDRPNFERTLKKLRAQDKDDALLLERSFGSE